MATDIEQVCVQIDSFVQETLLGRDAGIARENHAKVSVLQDECDGVVVDGIVAFAANNVNEAGAVSSRRSAYTLERPSKLGYYDEDLADLSYSRNVGALGSAR